MNSTAQLNMIADLDLGSIKAKLMHKESGEGWSLAQADAVELEYRRFLCLMKLYPEEQVALLSDVDIFWHYHILDTMKYAADCERIFGYFLHHLPADGEQGEDEHAVHQRNAARMQELYETTFGQAYPGQKEQGTGTAELAPAITAWWTPMTASSAWCTPATPKTAWCTPATPKTAWCTPATAKSAWCTPATPKTAWCTPATPKSACNTPMRGKTAWCTPATALAARRQVVAPNDQLYVCQLAIEAA